MEEKSDDDQEHIQEREKHSSNALKCKKVGVAKVNFIIKSDSSFNYDCL